MSARLLGRVVAGYALALLVLALVVARRYGLPPAPPPLAQAERDEVVARLRGALAGSPLPATSGVATDWRGWSTLWCGGAAVVRTPIESRAGRGVAAAGDGAGEAWRAPSDGLGRDPGGCRIKVDVARGRAPVSMIEPLLSLALVPGVDGLALDFGGREVVLLPDELLAADALGSSRPIPSVDFELGLDGRAALRMLAQRAGADSSSWRATPHALSRLRTEGFVEPAGGGPALAVFRAHTPGPPLTRATLHASALAGADYLLSHLRDPPEGSGGGVRFDYEYYTLSDQRSPDDGDYSWPRHAGAAHFLAQAARATGDPRYADGARRAIEALTAAVPAGCDRPGLACVGDPRADRVDLGTSALSLAAAVEYQRATSDARFAPWADRLAAFLLAMQKDNGDFCHLYTPATGARDERTTMLYFSGEGAFGLAKLDRSAPTPERIAAIDRALDHLTGAAYANLAGKFFFGEDHWTCLAVDEAWERLPPGRRDRYGDFCEGFARFLRRGEYLPGDGALVEQPDLLGAYGFTPLMPPHPTPVGSRSEAVLSSLRVATLRGHDGEAAAERAQLLASFRFLVDHQVRDPDAYLMPNPAAARGGFLMSDVKRVVRIDYVQHTCSALLRGEGLADR